VPPWKQDTVTRRMVSRNGIPVGHSKISDTEKASPFGEIQVSRTTSSGFYETGVPVSLSVEGTHGGHSSGSRFCPHALDPENNALII
jgi:hypothetical protein